MTKALVPGSFDPMTAGHTDIVRRAARIFDRVFVAIMTNCDKKGMFSFAERKAIAEASCAGIPNVMVITADGLLAELAATLGCVIVKGTRNVADFEYEQELALINDSIVAGTETVFMPASREYLHVSSTYVKELIKYGKSLEGAVMPEAAKLIAEYTACPNKK